MLITPLVSKANTTQPAAVEHLILTALLYKSTFLILWKAGDATCGCYTVQTLGQLDANHTLSRLPEWIYCTLRFFVCFLCIFPFSLQSDGDVLEEMDPAGWEGIYWDIFQQ